MVFQDQWTLNGSENNWNDGHGILYDEVSEGLYDAGTLSVTGQGANEFFALIDTNRDLVDSMTMSGPDDDTDKAKFMVFDDTRHFFVSGSMSQVGTNYDIWVGKFTEVLTFVDNVVVAGPTTDEDKGYGIVFDPAGTIFVTGTMIEPNESYNIWIGHLDVSELFTDGFESRDMAGWTATEP